MDLTNCSIEELEAELKRRESNLNLEKQAELIEKLKAKKEEIKALQTDVEILGKELIEVGSKNVFAQIPKLEYFFWTQYTPYFNDGEPCYFSSNHDYPDMQFSEGVKYGSPDYNQAKEAIKKVLEIFTDSDMEDFFGDHVQVTVSRSGLTVEEYDHD